MLCGSSEPFRSFPRRAPNENFPLLVFASVLKAPCNPPFSFGVSLLGPSQQVFPFGDRHSEWICRRFAVCSGQLPRESGINDHMSSVKVTVSRTFSSEVLPFQIVSRTLRRAHHRACPRSWRYLAIPLTERAVAAIAQLPSIVNAFPARRATLTSCLLPSGSPASVCCWSRSCCCPGATR